MDTKQPGVVRRGLGWLWERKCKVVFFTVLTLVVGYGITFVVVENQTSTTDRRVTLADGRTLAYRVHAAPANPVGRVVLVHGAPADATSWDHFLSGAEDQLDGYEVYVVDRLGYGNSSAGVETSLLAHAESLRPLLDSDAPVVLVGHSFGGPIVVRAAAAMPELVDGVVVGAGACDPDMKDSVWLREAIDAISPVVPTPWAVGNAELLALTDENRSLRAAGALADVACPVGVVHGTWDPVCPHDGTVRALEGALANADVHVESLARVGHNVHISHPTELVDAIDWCVERCGEAE